MDSSQRIARALSRGRVRVLLPSVLVGLMLTGCLGALAYWLAAPLLLAFVFAAVPGAVTALWLRGRLGGRWLLRTLNGSPREDWPELIERARLSGLALEPGSVACAYFGPDKLTEHDLSRRYRQAEQVAARRQAAPPPGVRSSRRPSQEATSNLARSATRDVASASPGREPPPDNLTLEFDREGYYRRLREYGFGFIGVVLFVLLFDLPRGFIWAVGIAMAIYLVETNWRGFRDLWSGRSPLRLDPDGIEVAQDGQLTEILWRDVRGVHIRITRQEEEEVAWLQFLTSRQGTVSLNLSSVRYGSLRELNTRIEEWRTWAHAERLRLALGG